MVYAQIGSGLAQGIGVITTASPPKEIGLLQRSEGLASGLAELNLRLAALNSKIAGVPQASGAEAGRPSGLRASLDIAEAELRECFALVGQLDSQF